jgi:hypothetical protein
VVIVFILLEFLDEWAERFLKRYRPVSQPVELRCANKTAGYAMEWI